MKNLIPGLQGEIVGDTLKLKDNYSFKRILSAISGNREVVPVVLNIKELKSNRSNNQNRYYWGVIIPILANYFGYLPDEMNEAIKFKFLRKGGTDKLPTVRSTTSLDKMEWEEFMTKIHIWSLQEFGIIIPTVDDYYNN